MTSQGLFAAGALAAASLWFGVTPLAHGAELRLESAACAGLVGMTVGDGSSYRGLGSIVSAVWTPASGPGNTAASQPEHCHVIGAMNVRNNGLGGGEAPGAATGAAPYAIGFRLRLPATWNTKLFFEGIGGTAGALGNATGGLQAAGATDNALLRGFAVVASDTGHRTVPGVPNGQFRYGYDPQARLEYGHLFLPVVTTAAEQVIQRAYQQLPSRKYFVGTSGGGRQGMKATQLYPELFDGVVSVVPAFRVPTTSVANMVMVQLQASIAGFGVDGVTKDIATAFSSDNLRYAAAQILQACDADDGLRDGMVSSPSRCRFNPKRLVCQPSAPEPGCFSTAQVEVFSRIHKGIPQYAPWNYDPGLATGWPGHRLGSPNTVAGAPNNAAISTLMAGFLAFDSVTPPLADPAANLYQYMLSADPKAEFKKLSATSALFPLPTTDLVDAASPNLDGFARRKGKLVIIHGLADPFFSPVDIARYVDRVTQRYGSRRAGELVRLFLVPGMNHGTGGPTVDVSDPLRLLDDWVETDVSPGSYVARVNPANAALPVDWSRTRSRLVCAYPKEAIYIGGDAESASSFACLDRQRNWHDRDDDDDDDEHPGPGHRH